MLEVKIRSVVNGYVVSWQEEYEDFPGTDFTREQVFQSDCESECDCSALILALYATLEELGECGSKHDTHRVHISCKCQKTPQDQDV